MQPIVQNQELRNDLAVLKYENVKLTTDKEMKQADEIDTHINEVISQNLELKV